MRKGQGKSVRPVTLTFDQAADAWWEAQATALSLNTQSAYRASLKCLRKVWGPRRLDYIKVNQVAEPIREMEADGRKGWTIKGCLTVAGRVFDYAGRRLDWRGNNPVSELDPSERPSNDEGEHINFTRDQLTGVIRQAAAKTKIIGPIEPQD
jgi:site-specific recombinase XerD